MKSPLDYATEYFSLQWMPIYLPERAKNPGRTGWQKERLKQVDLPNVFRDKANIGLLLGEPSNWLGEADLDCKEAIALASEFLPNTGRKSGRGASPSSHWWFYVKGLVTRKFEDPMLRGSDERAMILELRSTGCHTLVPPSVHPTGDVYLWNDEGNPARVSSDELLLAASKLAACSITSRYWQQGKRHNQSLALAGVLLRAGWSVQDAEHFITAAARVAGDEELADRQQAVHDTAERLSNGGAATGIPRLTELFPKDVAQCIVKWLGIQSRTSDTYGTSQDQTYSENLDWPDLEPLPVGLLPVPAMQPELLPDTFAPWLTDIAERMQCPLDYPAVGALVALAATVGNQIAIRPKRHDDWTVIPNLYGAVVGRPGVLKSPALDEASKPLKRLAAEAREQHEQAMKEWTLDRMTAEAKKDKLKDDVKKAVRIGDDFDKASLRAQLEELEEMAEPKERRYIINDSTVEKVGELLNLNPRGLLLFRDELVGWLKTLDREGHEGDRGFYLEAWNGQGSFTYDRIVRGTLHIKTVTLSVLGGIQPGPLAAYLRATLLGGQGDDGLLQRFQLLVYPDVTEKWRNVDRYPNTECKNRAFEVFKKLDKLDVAEVGAFLPDEGDSIPYLRFDEEAQQLFNVWREDLEKELRSKRIEHPALEAHLSKYRSLMPSLALLFHLIDRVDGRTDQTSISIEATAKAAAWCAYLFEHAKRIYGMGINSTAHLAKALAEHIKQGDLPDPFKARDVYRKHWTGLTSSKEVAEPLELLADLGWIRPVVIQTGGRSTTHYLINPKIRGKQ
jgi:Bifunctional DNA primase/polymerase, N-terminal.